MLYWRVLAQTLCAQANLLQAGAAYSATAPRHALQAAGIVVTVKSTVVSPAVVFLCAGHCKGTQCALRTV